MTLIYTQSEAQAMQEAKVHLLNKEFCKTHKRSSAFTEEEISKRHLAITVLLSKCRPEESAIKYIQWLQALSPWGITKFTDEQLTHPPNQEQCDHYLGNYKLAEGKDVHDRRIYWIEGDNSIPNDIEEEKLSIFAAIRYHMALHADPNTLREGLTFVVNLGKKGKKPTMGNEKRLQASFNACPLRPQRIYIVGANKVVRALVNALVKIGSLVSKNKVLKRLKFATLEEIADLENEGLVPVDSLPKHLKERKNDHESTSKHEELAILIEWVNGQIATVPMPDI